MMALSWRRVVFFIPTSFPIGSMVFPIPVLVRPVVAAAVVLQPLHLVRHRLLALSATFHSSHRKTHSSGDLRNFHPFGWLSFARLSISMLACVFAWKCNWLWSRELSGLQKASKRLKRSQFADLSIQQGWKWWWLSRIIREGVRSWGGVDGVEGGPSWSLNGPSFHPSSALTRPSLATALSAHLPPTPPHGSWTVIHHSWTEDSGETRAATWNPHLVLASHPPTTEVATQFSFHQLPTMWDSVYVLGSGGHCSKMSGWRSWKSCWIFLQFYHSSLPLWTRIVLPNFSDQRSNKRKYWNHSAREKHQHEKRKIGFFWWITKSWQIMIQLLQTSTL